MEIKYEHIDMILAYLQKMHPEPVYLDGIFRQIGNDDWKFRELVKEYLIENELAHYHDFDENDGRFKILKDGKNALQNGGIKNWLDLLQTEKEAVIQKENYKHQLEMEKSEREIEKLKYEQSVRELTEQNLKLNSENARLTSLDTKIKWFIAVMTFIIGLIIQHKFLIIDLLLRAFLQ